VSLSQEHLARMQEGRKRRDEEEARQKRDRQAAYSTWVREDARLWRVYLSRREATLDPQDPDRLAAYRDWYSNARRMPRLP